MEIVDRHGLALALIAPSELAEEPWTRTDQPIDVVRLLTERVAEQAQGLLADVAMLAAAFGWSEGDVLAMSPARQRAYLGLARARV